MSMNKEEFDIVLKHMREANQFAKDVRTYNTPPQQAEGYSHTKVLLNFLVR